VKIGSMFAGYSGLEMGVMQVLDAQPAWFAEIDEAPARILHHHYPHVPNLGDVTRVDWGSVEPVDIITAGYPCFTGDTPVLTEFGYKPISQVEVGMKVLTHKNNWKSVTAVMAKESETLEFLPGMFTTPNHRFLTREPYQKWVNSVRQYRRFLHPQKWVTASSLKGLFVAQPINIPEVHEPPELPEGITMWHLGRWVADGHMSPFGTPILSIGKNKLERDSEHFPSAQWRIDESRTAFRATYRHGGLEEFFKSNFGSSAHTKTIPTWLLTARREDRQEFLDGYISGDGYKEAAQIRCVTVSGCLASGIRNLASGLGYTTSQEYQVPKKPKLIEGRAVNERPWWRINIAKDDGRYTVREENFMWSKIRKPLRHGAKSTVYDLTVEDDHSFIAGGLVVHNCQPFSQAGKRKGTTDERHLWPYVYEAIKHLRPRFAFFENVRGHLTCGFSEVLEDLASIGWDAQWACVRASDVGAPHHRERLFILAYPDSFGQQACGFTRRPAEKIAWDNDLHSTLAGLNDAADIGHEMRLRWGDAAPAILTWAILTGHNPPPIVGDRQDYRAETTTEFIEFMMGLPPGWVTQVPGLTRNQQLKALGNGVVPQAAATALQDLLART
jgi:DNA (cytosine-5)-methyltransferase 1